MALVSVTIIPCRAAVKNSVVLNKRLLSFYWRNNVPRSSIHINQLFGATKLKHTKTEGRSYAGSTPKGTSKNKPHTRTSARHQKEQTQRSKKWKAYDRKQPKASKQRHLQWDKNQFSPSLVQLSQYSYKISSGKDTASTLSASSTPPKKNCNTAKADIMQSIDASSLLDPLNYCKGSVKLSPNLKHGGRSISGTDAAMRLLRGKKDFLSAARDLDAPVVLNGHGVPPALFQHCVDMADALLQHYGPDVVECSFHNYYSNSSDSSSKTPLHVRVRRRDATNSCLPPPSISEPTNSDRNTARPMNNDTETDESSIDWDYNMTLYLTVMERLARSLGQVLELSSSKPEKDNKMRKRKNLHSSRHSSVREHDDDVETSSDDADDDDDASLVSSPLLFPPPRPRWNVDILRGSYFDFQPLSNTEHEGDEPVTVDPCDHTIRPFPIVEFIQQPSARSSGHVLIRLQGLPVPNPEFGNSRRKPQQPVTLVFDACFQNPRKMKTEAIL